ncbi:hypothetical protein ACF1AX_24765 [Streptomyces sp. NPDC014802]
MRETIAAPLPPSPGTTGEGYHDRGDFLHLSAVTAHRPGCW